MTQQSGDNTNRPRATGLATAFIVGGLLAFGLLGFGVTLLVLVLRSG